MKRSSLTITSTAETFAPADLLAAFAWIQTQMEAVDLTNADCWVQTKLNDTVITFELRDVVQP